MDESKPNAIAIRTGQRGLVLTNLDDMERWAKGVIASGLAPETLDTAPKVIVATQYGLELGLTPMVALNSICVVKGRPTLWGDAALAMVKRSGLSEYVKEKVTGTGDKMCAYVESKRKDTGEIVNTEFSVDDAKTANLWTKAGSWKTHPKRMLKYKARAFNLRDNFPDVLGGLHLTEEMEGEALVPLEKPECDTPPRNLRRKPVESTTVTDLTGSNIAKPENAKPLVEESIEPSAQEQPVEPNTEVDSDVAGSAGIEEGSLLADKTAALKTANDLGDLKEAYDEKEGNNFTEWAAYVLCVGEDELEKPEDFTADRIEQLKIHLSDKGV